MLRFFRLRYVFEQEGKGWFEDAQIPTNLIVLEARPTAEVCKPVCERADEDSAVRRVRFRREFNLARLSDDEFVPNEFLREINSADRTFRNSHFSLSVESEQQLLERLRSGRRC